jgi:predicted CoA-binding protein
MSAPEVSWAEPSDDAVRGLLREVRTVAVLGASADPSRASNEVAEYLLKHTDYQVYLVNPNITEALDQPVYPSLASLPVIPDLVDTFRRISELPSVLAEVIRTGVKAWWLQLDLWVPALAQRAEAAGVTVVMDRCLMVEHARHQI